MALGSDAPSNSGGAALPQCAAAAPPTEVVILKLGGSSITDKSQWWRDGCVGGRGREGMGGCWWGSWLDRSGMMDPFDPYMPPL